MQGNLTSFFSQAVLIQIQTKYKEQRSFTEYTGRCLPDLLETANVGPKRIICPSASVAMSMMSFPSAGIVGIVGPIPTGTSSRPRSGDQAGWRSDEENHFWDYHKTKWFQHKLQDPWRAWAMWADAIRGEKRWEYVYTANPTDGQQQIVAQPKKFLNDFA